MTSNELPDAVGASTTRPKGRAARLRSDESIAGYFTRTGRFARVDPRRGRPLPSLAKLVGVVGWALLLEETARRAWRTSRSQE